MKKIFCDRCGKEIKDRQTLAWLRNRTIYATLLKDSNRCKEFEHDICSDCEDKFIYWFNHPEEDK